MELLPERENLSLIERILPEWLFYRNKLDPDSVEDAQRLLQLALRAKNDFQTKKALLMVIAKSSVDSRYAIAAKNATSVLAKAKIRIDKKLLDDFGLSFHGVRISGAQLSGGVFVDLDMSGAVCFDTNFTNSILRGTNLQQAVLQGAQFHESYTPKICEVRDWSAIAVSPCGRLLVRGDTQGNMKCYLIQSNYRQCHELNLSEADAGEIIKIAFTQTNEILVVTKDGKCAVYHVTYHEDSIDVEYDLSKTFTTKENSPDISDVVYYEMGGRCGFFYISGDRTFYARMKLTISEDNSRRAVQNFRSAQLPLSEYVKCISAIVIDQHSGNLLIAFQVKHLLVLSMEEFFSCGTIGAVAVNSVVGKIKSVSTDRPNTFVVCTENNVISLFKIRNLEFKCDLLKDTHFGENDYPPVDDAMTWGSMTSLIITGGIVSSLFCISTVLDSIIPIFPDIVRSFPERNSNLQRIINFNAGSVLHASVLEDGKYEYLIVACNEAGSTKVRLWPDYNLENFYGLVRNSILLCTLPEYSGNIDMLFHQLKLNNQPSCVHKPHHIILSATETIISLDEVLAHYRLNTTDAVGIFQPQKQSLQKGGAITTGYEQAPNYDQLRERIPEINYLPSVRFVLSEEPTCIGKGSFGSVYRYLDSENAQAIVAIKKLQEGKLTSKNVLQFYQEIQIHQQLDHNNIVKLVGVVNEVPFWLVMEFCEKGSLFNLVSRDKLPELAIRQRYAQGLIDGLCYLHNLENPLVHGDLKDTNVLVSRDDVVKISDFGMSFFQNVADKQTTNGTVAWMAPEVKKGYGNSTQSDVYSLGLLLLEIFAWQFPFINSDTSILGQFLEVVSQRDQQTNHTKPTLYPRLNKIMMLCCQQQSRLRPSAMQSKTLFESIETNEFDRHSQKFIEVPIPIMSDATKNKGGSSFLSGFSSK